MGRARPARVLSLPSLLALAAGSSGCSNDCNTEIHGTVVQVTGQPPTLLATWTNAWMGAWYDLTLDGLREWRDEPKSACSLSPDRVEIVALEGLRVTWSEPPDQAPVDFETPINDGWEQMPLPRAEGTATVELIGRARDGREHTLGISEPFSTAAAPCSVQGPITDGGEGPIEIDAQIQTGAVLRVPALGLACDPSGYTAVAITDTGTVDDPMAVDTDLTEGSVDFTVPPTMEGGRYKVLLHGTDLPDVSGPLFAVGADGCVVPDIGSQHSGEPTFFSVSAVAWSDCQRFVGPGSTVLRRVGSPATRFPVELVQAGNVVGFTVPEVPSGDYVLSLDQVVASIDSPPFHVVDRDELVCALPGPVVDSTLYTGEPQHVPIANTATCDLVGSANLGASLFLDYDDAVDDESLLLEDLAGLTANASVDFTIPLTVRSSAKAYIGLFSDSQGETAYSPWFRVEFRECALSAPAAGSGLEIGESASVRIDRGDLCVPHRRYDGAYLWSVDDPTGFTPVLLDGAADLEDGTIDFEVPAVPPGIYTVFLPGLGDDLTSPDFRIVAPGSSDPCWIQVDAPVAGTKVNAGATVDVAWWSDCGVPLDIALMKGAFPIASPVLLAEDEPDDGAATVTIPEGTALDDDYRLCVQTPDGLSVDCSAPFEVKEGCTSASTLTWTPTGSSTPTSLPVITVVSSSPIMLAIQQGDIGTPVWGGMIYSIGLAPGQALTQATGALMPDAQGESLWSTDDDASYPPQAMSTSVTGTVTAWTPDQKLTVTGLSAAITSGNPSYTGTLAGSFTWCAAEGP